jgi:hypothetical protein
LNGSRATTRRSALLLGLVSVVLTAAAGGSAVASTTVNPARVVAITATKPARLILLDARTLRPAQPGWSRTLAAWSPDDPAALSPLGSRVAIVVGGESGQSLLIVDTATGRVLRRVGDVYAEQLYWLRGEGVTRRSPALVVEASLACASGGVPGGVCGDEVDVAWTTDPRLRAGGGDIYNGFAVDQPLRREVVLSAETPKGIVLEPLALDDPYIELPGMPDKAQFRVVTDVLNDRVFVVTSTGRIARVSRASAAEPRVDYRSVELNGRPFEAAWAGAGRIALWGADGLGTIDTRTWTTHAIAPGVVGVIATRNGIAAWTDSPDGLSVYRPDGNRRLRLLEGTQVTAARAIGDYLYADTRRNARYAIDLRTGRVVGPLETRARIIGPSFVTLP